MLIVTYDLLRFSPKYFFIILKIESNDRGSLYIALIIISLNSTIIYGLEFYIWNKIIIQNESLDFVIRCKKYIDFYSLRFALFQFDAVRWQRYFSNGGYFSKL